MAKFKSGESGNPHGRPPKEQALTNLLQEYLEEESVDFPGVTRKKLLIQQIFNLAMKGDIVAARYIFDRIDGKIPENINATINSFSEWVKSVSPNRKTD